MTSHMMPGNPHGPITQEQMEIDHLATRVKELEEFAMRVRRSLGTFYPEYLDNVEAPMGHDPALLLEWIPGSPLPKYNPEDYQ